MEVNYFIASRKWRVAYCMKHNEIVLYRTKSKGYIEMEVCGNKTCYYRTDDFCKLYEIGEL